MMSVLVFVLLLCWNAAAAPVVLQGGEIDPRSAHTILGTMTPSKPYRLGDGSEGTKLIIQLVLPVTSGGSVVISLASGGSFDLNALCPVVDLLYSNKTGWSYNQDSSLSSGLCGHFYPSRTSNPDALQNDHHKHDTVTTTSSVSISSDGLVVATATLAELKIKETHTLSADEWTTTYTETKDDDDSVKSRKVVFSASGNTLLVSRIRGDTSATNNTLDVYMRNTTRHWVMYMSFSAPSDSEYAFDFAVSRNAEIILVGCPGQKHNGIQRGAVIVYALRNITAGYQQLYQLSGPSDEFLRFGESIDLNSDMTRLVVGAPGFKNWIGMVVYYHINFTHPDSNQISAYTTPDLVGYSRFGSAVAISADGNSVFVGGHDAACDGDQFPSGALWVMKHADDSAVSGLVHKQRLCLPRSSDEASPKHLGRSIAINDAGTTLVAGAPGYSKGGAIGVWTRASATYGHPFVLKAIIKKETSDTPFSAIGWSLGCSANGARCVTNGANTIEWLE